LLIDEFIVKWFLQIVGGQLRVIDRGLYLMLRLLAAELLFLFAVFFRRLLIFDGGKLGLHP